MAYFVLGLCLIGALIVAGRVLLTADPKKLAKIIRYTAGTVMAVATLALLAFGRPMLAGLLGMGALLAFGRSLPQFGPGGGLLGLLGSLFGGTAAGRGPAGWGGRAGPAGAGWGDVGGGGAAGRTSRVETAWLRMELDHETGEMSGTVLQGEFRGRRIEDLQAEQLVALLRECEVRDPGSVSLLEAYLDRTTGPAWRQQAGSAAGASGAGAGGAGTSGTGSSGTGGSGAGAGGGTGGAAAGGRMSAREAREVLGVPEGAGPEAVREAHRRLMKKLHPDHGGSNYLAGKINEAKDVLLGT